MPKYSQYYCFHYHLYKFYNIFFFSFFFFFCDLIIVIIIIALFIFFLLIKQYFSHETEKVSRHFCLFFVLLLDLKLWGNNVQLHYFFLVSKRFIILTLCSYHWTFCWNGWVFDYEVSIAPSASSYILFWILCCFFTTNFIMDLF